MLDISPLDGIRSPFGQRRGGSGPVPAFSPTSLYSTGSQGIWLDPSDLSTMFSDRAGTTPVTTPGTVVGVRLDKSKGLVLGAELVSNPGPFANTTGWLTTSATPLAVSGGILTGTTAVATDGVIYGAWLGVSAQNKYFQITTTITALTGRVRFQIYGSNVVGPWITSPGTYTIKLYQTVANGSVGFNTDQATTVSVSAFSAKEISGNHAVAPTDAARPIYGVEPKGGRRNLLLATDTLATQSLTVTAVAHTLAFTGTGTVTLTGASTAGPLVGTGAGDRVSLTFTPTAASLTLTVSGSVTLGQLELGSSATAYQKVVTAYDVTESGVATCHYVQYDGVNGFLQTSVDANAILGSTGSDPGYLVVGGIKFFTATVAASAFARSAFCGDSAGYFGMWAHTINGGEAGIFQWDTGVKTAERAYSVGSSAIITGRRNPLEGAAGKIYTSVNGVSSAGTDAAALSAAAGTLVIGKQFGTFMNGRDYGIIIVGKTASAGEITDTETWLAARTAQVTL